MAMAPGIDRMTAEAVDKDDVRIAVVVPTPGEFV